MNMQQLIQESQRIQRNYQKELAIIEDGEYEFTANGAIKAVLKGTFEWLKN